jgi:23S rRNA pseudouridine1911/1915/1917 synthase
MAVSDTRSDDSVPTPDAELLRFVITSDLSGQRVDSALAALCGLPRARVSRWIALGRVRLGEETVARASRRVREGDRLEAHPPKPAETEIIPEAIPLEILFEDADLVVVDKPAGMVVHPAPGHSTGTLVNALLHHCGDLAGVGGVLRPGIVHRLDRGTSGVMVVAKNDFSHRRIAEQFHDHSIERIYRAAVRNVPRLDEGRVDRPIGRHLRDRKKMSVRSRSLRPAATRWRVVERFLAQKVTWLEIRPETGRTHQIRVHLASIGLPVCGDPVYGRSRKSRKDGLPSLARPALHAAVLGFNHPRSGEIMRFEAPLHADLVEFLDRLREQEK